MAKKKIKPRYVDANLVKEALIGWDTDATDEEIEYAIDNISTADVVEVVRCKDCQYVHINSSSGLYHCKRRGYYSEEVKPTDFCSYGK